jgi:hypothetical protein
MSSFDPKHLFRLSRVVLGSLFIFLGITYLFGLGVVHLLNSVQSDIGKTLIAASVTVFVAVITLVLGKLLEQRLKIRDEIRAKKVPIYEGHIQVFFEIFFSPLTTGKPADPKKMASGFASVSEKLVTWGSVGVIKAWNDFRSTDPDTNDPQRKLDKLEGVFRAIREDLGNDVKNLESGELLRMFINDYQPSLPNAKAAQPLP